MYSTEDNDFFDFYGECNMVPIQENILYDFESGSYNMVPTQDNIVYDFEAEIEAPLVVSTPFELLKLYGGTKTKRFNLQENDHHHHHPHHHPPCHKSISSAATIMKLVRSRLLELNSENPDIVFSVKTHQSIFDEEIEIAMALQVAAEQVIKKRFVSARKLLNKCQDSASKTGTPLQRIVYYFSQALEQKMNQDWGFIITPNVIAENPMDVTQTLNTLQPAWISGEQRFSASVVCQYTSVQSILDNVASATRIHLIDLRIKNGSHWTVLIQALAVRYERPIELLKITAVGTSNELLEETGKWLSSFAETMNVPFMFKVVLSDLKEIKKQMFKVETDETLIIYSSLCLWSVLAWPNDLEKLIKQFKELSPCLMVLNEIDANLNSPDFVERFIETLFYISGVFDGLMMNFENHPSRKLIEEGIYADRIRNIITCEGTERTYRYEKASFWRALFEKCGFMETELTPSTLSQAKLLLDTSVSGLYIETDGKCLTTGWNGTPLEFVSSWTLKCRSRIK